MAYAQATKVPISQSKGEIEELLRVRAGASHIGSMTGPEGSFILFTLGGRNYRIRIPEAESGGDDRVKAQRERSIWRSVQLVVKSLVVAHEEGIFDLSRS